MAVICVTVVKIAAAVVDAVRCPCGYCEVKWGIHERKMVSRSRDSQHLYYGRINFS
jgi:hypothetical protein